MTSITGAGGPSPLATWGHNRNGGGAVQDAATALNLTQNDLRTELESGKSLGQVADEQGVSRDDLAAALKAGAPSRLQRAGDADQQINQMIDNPGGPEASGMARYVPPPPGPPPGPDPETTLPASQLPADQQDVLARVSDMLGTDPDSLLTALRRGDRLADLMGQAGIADEDIASAVQDAAAAGLPGPDEDATGVLSGSLTQEQQSTLNSLAAMLGTEPGSLLTSLQSGASLANMVSQAGISKSDLASVLQNGLMFDATA